MTEDELNDEIESSPDYHRGFEDAVKNSAALIDRIKNKAPIALDIFKVEENQSLYYRLGYLEGIDAVKLRAIEGIERRENEKN